jgi:AhpC/TSA family protein
VRYWHRIMLGAVAAFAGLLLLSCQAADSTSPTSTGGLREGEMAPDFELPSAGGGDVRLSDYRGEKPVLLYFSMGPG